jgi:hypothetical protein
MCPTSLNVTNHVTENLESSFFCVVLQGSYLPSTARVTHKMHYTRTCTTENTNS